MSLSPPIAGTAVARSANTWQVAEADGLESDVPPFDQKPSTSLPRGRNYASILPKWEHAIMAGSALLTIECFTREWHWDYCGARW